MNQMTELSCEMLFETVPQAMHVAADDVLQSFECRVHAFRRLDEQLACNYDAAMQELERFEVSDDVLALNESVARATRALEALEAFESLRLGMLLVLERD